MKTYAGFGTNSGERQEIHDALIGTEVRILAGPVSCVGVLRKIEEGFYYLMPSLVGDPNLARNRLQLIEDRPTLIAFPASAVLPLHEGTIESIVESERLARLQSQTFENGAGI